VPACVANCPNEALVWAEYDESGQLIPELKIEV
jgi:Fe-S-cluster-containing dehydrogenase component